MRITLRLDDDLHRAAKQQAQDEGVTLSALVEAALRERVARSLAPRTTEPRRFALDGCVEGDGTSAADVAESRYLEGFGDSDRDRKLEALRALFARLQAAADAEGVDPQDREVLTALSRDEIYAERIAELESVVDRFRFRTPTDR
jgi:hypothetical protein